MFDKKRIVREAQAEIERLRGRLDDLRAENETNSYNARRALARADRAETALAAARKELSALRTGQRPPKPVAECQNCKPLEKRRAILQAVNEALDVRVPEAAA